MPGEPILIAGPTASGKSGLALDMAERLGGAIINADSQQVFAGMPILTAQPTEHDQARVPHFLYGWLDPMTTYSTGQWLRDVEQTLDRCRSEGLRPIITGGTGLYFKVLTEGMAPIPPGSDDTRAGAEEALASLGLSGLVDALQRRDPETAAMIDLANSMRVLRAWEVLETTGKGLAAWHRETTPPLIPLGQCTPLVIAPVRETLYARCDQRFDAMLVAGALGEVTAMKAQGLPPTAPGLKALGYSELAAYLDGTQSREDAIEAGKMATRRYAKRQLTWGRNQMSAWHRLASADAPLPHIG